MDDTTSIATSESSHVTVPTDDHEPIDNGVSCHFKVLGIGQACGERPDNWVPAPL